MIHAPPPDATYRKNTFRDRSIQVLTVLGYALPVAIYLWYLHHYSLNVVSGDQWSDVRLITASYKGKLTLGALWAQHNENRIFFPNLVMLGLSRSVAFNVVVEQYLGAGCLFGATALIISAHKRRSPTTPWLTYCPVAILMLSVVQGNNTLSGFQLAWYMIVIALAGVIFLLDREQLSWLTLAASIVLAIVGSFSSIQGLFIWVAGLMLLYYRRRSFAEISLWIGFAIPTIVLYFYGYHSSVASSSTATHLLGDAVQFYFQLIGSILGIPLSGYGRDADIAAAFGCVVVALALYSLWSRGRRRDPESPAPIGLALIVYGLLFALSTTYGRVFEGPAGAASSRYTTYDLLIVVGTYLTYVGSPPSLRRSGAARRRPGHSVVPLVLGAVILVQALFGFVNGIHWARQNYDAVLDVAIVTTDAGRLPDRVVQGVLDPEDPNLPVSVLRGDVQILADHGLTFFSDEQIVRDYREQADLLAREGVFERWSLLWGTRTSIVLPHAGSMLTGKTFFLASVENDPDLHKVYFELANAEGERNIGFATHSEYGWGLFWKSSDVPNGDYQLRSVAIDRNDHVTTSAPTSVTVRN
jgi:hypothetical protein